MTKWTIALAGILTVLLAALANATLTGDDGGAHAHIRRFLHGGAMHGQPIDAHLDEVATKLELSASQRKLVAATLVAALPELETKILALVEAHAKQCDLVHATPLDEEALRTASTRLGVAHGEVAIAVARMLRELHRVLTPEQLDRLAQLHRPDLLGLVAEHVRGVRQGMKSWADRQ